MQTTLIERVDELVQAHKRELLSTTPTTKVIAELAERIETLERVVREIALEVERLGRPREQALLDQSVARRFRRSSLNAQRSEHCEGDDDEVRPTTAFDGPVAGRPDHVIRAALAWSRVVVCRRTFSAFCRSS